jgi:F-type H+-transporting ATPase subunit delta
MSDNNTIARPYAKAIFEHALAKNELSQWSEYLFLLAQIVLNGHASEFIRSPASSIDQQVELLKSLSEALMKKDQSLNNVISLLANNRRLLLLPEIKALYEAHKAEQEKTLDVLVVSFSPLASNQQEQMLKSLNKRMQRKVSLTIHIDPSLLGGAVIYAGNFVIDGSIRGKLNKLRADLAT